jgi:hypothetical protein
MRHAFLVPLLLSVLASLGQSQSVSAVTVRGSVLDAGSGAAISGAQLTLTGATPSVLPESAGPSPVLNSSRIAATDSTGRYEIPGVTSGSYRLFVRRLGYLPATIDLQVGDASRDARLSFGLVVVPIRLEPVQIDAERLNTFGRLTLPAEGEESVPVMAVRARQSAFLSTDVRDLTAPGSLLAGGTGEIDLLRALRRFPGVTGKDDHSAELWVRGARWDQVRLSYDGLPIFNPFHASETITGVSSDAIGAAFLHPGVRPVSLLSQGPSLIDLRSRAATDTAGRWIGGASRRDVSLGYENARPDGTGGWVATGRTTYTGFFGFNPGFPRDQDVLGDYTELTFRADRQLGGGKSVQMSGLRTEDKTLAQLYGLSPSGTVKAGQLPVGSRGLIYRFTLNHSIRQFRASQTVGFSSYSTEGISSQYPLGVVDTVYLGQPFPPGLHSSNGAEIRYLTLRGEIHPASVTQWKLGYEIYRFHTSSNALAHDVSWRDRQSEAFRLRRTRVITALWGERRWAPFPRLAIDAGVRLETPNGALKPRLAPSAQARLRINPLTHLSIGASQSYQDAQEVPFTSVLSSTTRGYWFLSGSGFPALRADQVSVGVDRWFGSAFVLDVNAFSRLLRDVAVRPLPLADILLNGRPHTSAVSANGIEFSLRKLAGRVTGSVGYTFAKSTETIEGQTSDATGDRRHELDVATMWRTGQYRIGGAFTYMSGAPYTRLFVGRGILVQPDSVVWISRPSSGARNAQRFPGFASLDLFVERTGTIRGTTATPYIGLQNALNNMNFTELRALQGWASSGAEGLPDQLDVTRIRHLNLGVRIVF